MGQFNNLPDENRAPGTPSAEAILHTLTQDLQTLQRTVSSQLSQDVERLQSQKRKLMEDIEALEGDYEQLQARYQSLRNSHDVVLSQQQQAQQQLWAKRLAQALATHLHARLSETLVASMGMTGMGQDRESLPQTNPVLASLDATLHSTLQSLQQDLNSYQSSLSQQISRMHSLEQQGEAILDALVNRLSQQLHTQMLQPPMFTAQQNGYGGVALPPMVRPLGLTGDQGRGGGNGTYGGAIAPPEPIPERIPERIPRGRGESSPGNGRTPVTTHPSPSPDLTPQPSSKKQLSNLQKGLLFIILSTLALSVHNVIVGLIGYGGLLLGRIPITGVFPLNIPNSLLLLWLRMVVVLPMMTVVATQLYPNVWRDIRQIVGGPDRRPMFQVIASGGFLFMSQVLIYRAISDIGPGVAVTLLFMYPLVTVPLAWFLFGDRPTSLRLVVMFAITMGIVFTALPRISADLAGTALSVWGVGSALLSSVAFALYLISMQLSFRRVHPVPVSLLQFSTIFVLSSTILILGSFTGLRPESPSSPAGLYLGGFLLGVLTLLGYLCNNYGVRFMGAAQASIVAASGPVITAILAYLITPGEKSALQFIQWIGVILVTLGVVSLSFERLATSRREMRQRKNSST